MALRGGPGRRVQGNPLGGVLRDLDRRSRPRTRRKPAAGPEGAPGQPGPRGPAGPPGRDSGAGAVVVTAEDGRAHWEFPQPFASPPVVTALAVDPDPAGATTVLVSLEEVEAGHVVLRVWSTVRRRTPGVVVPAGAGVRVHVTARPTSG